MSKQKVIGRYKSNYSGNVYDFISKDKAYVVDGGNRYKNGTLVTGLYTYSEKHYTLVSRENTIGGELL